MLPVTVSRAGPRRPRRRAGDGRQRGRRHGSGKKLAFVHALLLVG
jgi:hypothetical protein